MNHSKNKKVNQTSRNQELFNKKLENKVNNKIDMKLVKSNNEFNQNKLLTSEVKSLLKDKLNKVKIDSYNNLWSGLEKITNESKRLSERKKREIECYDTNRSNSIESKRNLIKVNKLNIDNDNIINNSNNSKFDNNIIKNNSEHKKLIEDNSNKLLDQISNNVKFNNIKHNNYLDTNK